MSRHPTTLTMSTIALLGLAAAFSGGGVSAQQKKPASILVHEVTSVDCTLEKSNPPNALVKAKGKVPTLGHTNPQLVLVLYVMPPVDGIQDLFFYVASPTGDMVPPTIQDVETPILRIEHIPSWMKGIRVRAETNKIEKSCS